jgi:hypothetical protein
VKDRVVLSVLERWSGSGQEETDGSHESQATVLVPSTIRVRVLSPRPSQNGAESESSPPSVTEKPADVRAAGTITDTDNVNPVAPRVQRDGRFRRQPSTVLRAASGSFGRKLQVSEDTTSGFWQACRNAKRPDHSGLFAVMDYNN